MLKRLLLGAAALIVWFGVLTGIQFVLHEQRAEIWARLIVAATLLVAYWAAGRFIEQRSVDELRPRDAAAVAYGFAGGFCLFLCTMAILMAAGVYHPASFGSAALLLSGLSLACTAAVAEELLFRGFIFRWLEQGLGTWIAVAISAALFGLAHAVNRGATPMSTVAIALEAGVLLSAAYVYSRTLWLPIGIHIGWNFTEGSVFGVAVSGHDATGGILSGTLSGPAWLAGGAFGVEASLPAVIVCLVAASALLVAARRRNRIVSPPWFPGRTTTSR